MRKITFIVFLFIFYYYSNAVTTIEKVEINPLNRTMIYLTSKPDGYNAELSPSKEKITLRLDNTKTKNNINISGSTGIIKNVKVTSFINFTEVLIELSDKRGFTMNYLPYSKSIMLEVFDWNKLNKEEDFYRLGLLSYNDGLLNEAESYFKKSASKDIPNAYFFLGMINLTKGRNVEAGDYFLLAEKFNCNISDNFAGLSEAFRLMQDSKRSNIYKAKFQKQSGISDIETIFYPETEYSNDITENYEPSFLSSNQYLTESASINDSSNQITLLSIDTNKNSAKPEIIEIPISSIKKDQNAKLLPEWLSNGMIYIFLILVLFTVMIMSLYKKWRKDQLIQQNTINNQKFKENLEQARKNAANSKQMANIYQKYEIKSKDEQNNNEDNQDNKKNRINKDNNSERINEIEILAKSIISEKIKNPPPPEDSKSTFNKKNENSALQKKLNPNLELALHLQNQNLQQKQKKLNEIQFDSVPELESENLSVFAKKTGIDTGSLKAKKTINHLLNDHEAKNNLSKKFLQKIEE